MRTPDPLTVATDLVSQAEHGPDTPAVLTTTSESVGENTVRYVDACLENLVTKLPAAVSWRNFGEVIVADNLDEAYELADAYASEHVPIFAQRLREALEKMYQYGAFVLGERHV
jgi:histidinol dehydrogenase